MTIVEMAEKYVLFNSTNVDEIKKDPFRYAIFIMAEQCFAHGAITVLEEIENIIKVGCDDIAFLNLLEDKIKELKGE